MRYGAENPTYQLVQSMIRGERCGMCGRSDLHATGYAVRDGRIVAVPRAQAPRLCMLCNDEWRSYRCTAAPAVLHETPAHVLADALAAIERPTSFTLVGYAAVTPEQWRAIAAGYLIVHEIRRRAEDCTRRMHAASRAA